MAMVIRTFQVPGAARRPGLTLLEMLVSMAIFLIALVALSRLIEIGSNLSRDANYQTEALRLAQSKLHEVMVGIEPLESQADLQFPENGDFYYSITCTNDPDVDDLWDVQVTVYRNIPGGKVSVTLGHILFDPSKRGSTASPSTASTSGGSQ